MAQVSFPITTFEFGNTQPVANGYLMVHLSKDCSIQDNGGQVAARVKVRVPLNSAGVASTTVLFWPNNELVPDDSTYIYSVFTDLGQRVLGPSSVYISTGGSGGLGFGEAFGSSFGS